MSDGWVVLPTDINNVILQTEGRILFDPKIFTNYYPQDSILRLWKPYLQCGFLKALVIRKRHGFSSFTQLKPAFFLLSIFASFAAALLTGQRESMAVVLGSYFLANIFAALAVGKRSIKTIVLSPIVFACMHIAYGVGFLAGLWRWKTFQPNVAAVPVQTILIPEALKYSRNL